MTEFYIGQTFKTPYPPEAALWCNENNAIIDIIDGIYTITEIPSMTQEELDRQRIAELQEYLNSTDWYATRFAETGVEIPAEIKLKRQEARDEISELRGE